MSKHLNEAEEKVLHPLAGEVFSGGAGEDRVLQWEQFRHVPVPLEQRRKGWEMRRES